MNPPDLPVRVLSLWRPWPTVILLGPKRVENRRTRWKIPQGGMLLVLHGAKRYDREGEAVIRERWPEFDQVRRSPPHPSLGCGLVGAVLVTGVVPVEELNGDPWASGPLCYQLRDPVPFRKRWEMRGSQGLWRLDTDEKGRLLQELIIREWRAGQGQQPEPEPAPEAPAEQTGQLGLFQ